MNATTLVLVNAPTLQDGLVELLRIADAVQEARRLGAGVWVQRDQDGRLVEAEADYDIAPGVLETSLPSQPTIDPWAIEQHPYIPPLIQEAAQRELVELLAQVNPSRDILATPDGVGYL